jgi:hypothetical protein
LKLKNESENETLESEGEREYVFAEKLKFVFEKVLAIFNLRDPLVQIHIYI